MVPSDMVANHRPVTRAGPAEGSRLELQLLILQSGLAAFYCSGAALGYFGSGSTALWLSVAWIGAYQAAHAWYVIVFRMRRRQLAPIEMITPALDISSLTVAWVALGDPDTAFWAIYLYALVGFARRIHGRAYAALSLFVLANLAVGRIVIEGGSVREGFDASLVTMLAITGSMAALASAIGRTWRLAESHARMLAETDPLTGLDNRRSFLEWLEASAQDPAGEFSVLMLDLDDFKLLNDEHGHLHGDDVLANVAAVMTANLRPGDHVARYGGEEFVAALPGAGMREAEQIADRLRQAVANSTPTTVSIGCAERAPLETAGSVLHRADAMLLIAKRQGKNRVRTANLHRPAA